jgi:hypothetical protein
MVPASQQPRSQQSLPVLLAINPFPELYIITLVLPRKFVAGGAVLPKLPILFQHGCRIEPQSRCAVPTSNTTNEHRPTQFTPSSS